MKIKIISLEDEKSISFKNSSLGFEIVDNNSKYYKVEQDIVEISYLLEKDVNIVVPENINDINKFINLKGYLKSHKVT